MGQREDEAFKLLQTYRPAVALLDIKLGTSDSLSLAQWCGENGIAVIFTSGYMEWERPDGCRDAPVLTKPFTAEDVERALGTIELPDAAGAD